MKASDVINDYILTANAVVIIIFNILQLVLINKWKQQIKSSSQIYVINLSVSDLLVGISVILMKIGKEIAEKVDGSSTARKVAIILRLFMLEFSMCASICLITGLAVARMWKIKRTCLELASGKRICAFSWLFTIIFVALQIFLTSKYTLFVDRAGDLWIYLNLVFPISVYAATCVYAYSFATIRREIIDSRRRLSSVHCKILVTKSISSDGKNGRRYTGKYSGIELKFMKIAMLQMLAFVVCWLPFANFLIYIIQFVKVFPIKDEKNLILMNSFGTLATFNSVINPIINLLVLRSRIKKFESKHQLTIQSNRNNGDRRCANMANTIQTWRNKTLPEYINQSMIVENNHHQEAVTEPKSMDVDSVQQNHSLSNNVTIFQDSMQQNDMISNSAVMVQDSMQQNDTISNSAVIVQDGMQQNDTISNSAVIVQDGMQQNDTISNSAVIVQDSVQQNYTKGAAIVQDGVRQSDSFSRSSVFRSDDIQQRSGSFEYKSAKTHDTRHNDTDLKSAKTHDMQNNDGDLKSKYVIDEIQFHQKDLVVEKNQNVDKSHNEILNGVRIDPGYLTNTALNGENSHRVIVHKESLSGCNADSN